MSAGALMVQPLRVRRGRYRGPVTTNTSSQLSVSLFTNFAFHDGKVSRG